MKRLDFIDVSKGIGILLVVFGHMSPRNSIIYKIIYSFHMPLFFIVAGYLYNGEKYMGYKTVDFIKKKFKSYIIPYFKMQFVCFIIFGSIKGFLLYGFTITYISALAKYLFGITYSIGNLEWMPNSSPLWFLTCLFCVEVIFFIIIKNMKKYYIYIGIFTVIGVIFSKVIHFRLPWNIDVAICVLFFTYVGLCIKKYHMLEKYIHYYTIPLAIIAIISVRYNTAINLNDRIYGNFILTYLSGTTISVIVLYYSRYLVNLKLLKFYGNNTIIIMGYNYALNSFYYAVLSNFQFMINHWIIKAVWVCILSTILIFVLNKKTGYLYLRERLI